MYDTAIVSAFDRVSIKYPSDSAFKTEALKCFRTPTFPKINWSPVAGTKYLTDIELDTTKIQFEGSFYVSDNQAIGNQLIVGETFRYRNAEEVNNYPDSSLFVSGKLYVSDEINIPSGTITTSVLNTSKLLITEKAKATVSYGSYEDILEFNLHTSAGRVTVNGIQTLDSMTKKTFRITNNKVYFDPDLSDDSVSTVLTSVVKYGNSFTQPIVCVSNITPGKFDLELSNFTNSENTDGVCVFNFAIM